MKSVTQKEQQYNNEEFVKGVQKKMAMIARLRKDNFSWDEIRLLLTFPTRKDYEQ